MDFLQSIRNFIQRNEAKHWQFIVLSIMLSFVGSVYAFFLEAKYGFNLLYITLVITSLFQSIISYIYMKEKGEARKVFLSLFFVFLTFFLGKYLIFEHYYDFYIGAYVDRSSISWSLISFYFSALNFEGLFLFIDQMNNFIGKGDVAMLLVILLITLLYKIMLFDNKASNNQESNKRVRFNNRRFN